MITLRWLIFVIIFWWWYCFFIDSGSLSRILYQ